MGHMLRMEWCRENLRLPLSDNTTSMEAWRSIDGVYSIGKRAAAAAIIDHRRQNLGGQVFREL